MKRTIKPVYEAPSVELLEVSIEQGFVGSDLVPDENTDLDPDGYWW